MTPSGLQLRRTRGYRLPDGAINVARPGKWGNPYKVGAMHPIHGWPTSAAEAVELYRDRVVPVVRDLIRSELRGHDLACWCRIGTPCHRDVLLEVANAD